MNYNELMNSLDKLPATDASMEVFSFISGVGSGVVLLLLIFYLKEYIRESTQLFFGNGEAVPFNQAMKELIHEYVFGLIFIILILATLITISVSFYTSAPYDLQDKISKSSSEVAEWETGPDLQNYLKTLPTLKQEVSPDQIETAHNALSVTFNRKGKKEVIYVEMKDTYKVRKEELREGEPRNTYIEYSILPHNITYNYPKGKIIPVKLVQVW